MGDFLSQSFLGNTVLDWIVALVVAVVVWAAVRIVVRVLLNRMKALAAKTKTDIDDLVTALLKKTKGLFVTLVAIYAGALSLQLSVEIDSLMTRLIILGFMIQGALGVNGIVNYILGSWARRQFEADPTITTALG